jgi:signal transduction histidine kinase
MAIMRTPRLANLHLTLIMTIVLPLLVISGIGVYWGLSVVQRQDEAQLKEDLALMAQATKYPLSRALQTGDYVQVNDITTSLFSSGRVYGASVYDKRGDRISQVGVVDTNITESRSAADAVARGDELGTYRRIEGEDVFSHFTPLFSQDGRIIGLLQITRRRSDFDQRLSDLRADAWWIWSIMGGAILFVAIAGHYGGVGRHVEHLQATMDRVRSGDRRVRAPLKGPREVQQIAMALNDMLASIEQTEQAMHAQKAREARLNQRLQHQEKMAMIGRVAGGVAHELGAPLSVIDGRARILERRGGDERTTRNLGEIRDQVQRMTRIIRQLLDCFRHSPRVEEDSLTMTELVNGVLDSHQSDAAEQGISLEVDNQAPDAEIQGDRTRLELAVTNLLRNAIQAASGKVLLSVRAGPQATALTVEDDGPGISTVDRESVFEPFYTTKPAGEGTGLGLAVVRSVMQEHGGGIIIGTSRWGGCAVVLQWPRSSADQRAEAGSTVRGGSER